MPKKDDIQIALEKVLNSNRFTRKPVLGPLLRYLVEKNLAGERHELKERTIAMDVFGKDSDYEGGDFDAIVRSNMHKLRQELTSYNEVEGQTNALAIQIKRGRYESCISFVRRETPSSPEVVVPSEGQAENAEPRTRSVLTVVAEFGKFDNVQDLEQRLREISGDPTLQIRQIHFGSHFFELDCKEPGARILTETQQRGTLSAALGYEIDSIRPAEEVYDQLRTEQHPALENCFSPAIDISRCNKEKLSVFIKCDLPEETLRLLDQSQTLEMWVHVSEDAKVWLSTHRPPILIGPQQINRELLYPIEPINSDWSPTTDKRFMRVHFLTFHRYEEDHFPTALFIEDVWIPNSSDEPAEVTLRKEVLTLVPTGREPEEAKRWFLPRWQSRL